jgi:hypothetical protein
MIAVVHGPKACGKSKWASLTVSEDTAVSKTSRGVLQLSAML